MSWIAAALAALSMVAPAPRAATPVAAHSMLYLDSPPALKATMLRETAALGMTDVRLDVGLSAIFTAPGAAPDWSRLDETLGLARRHGLRIIGVLLAPPYWLTDCPPGTPEDRAYTCPVGDPEAWGDLVAQVAAHAGPTVTAWEVLNEPDQSWAYRGTPAQYGRTLVATHAALRRAAPAATVVLGGVTNGARPWLRQAFEAVPAAERAFDVGAVHLRGDARDLPGQLDAWERFFADRGNREPVWVTEHGYPAARGGEAAQAAHLAETIPALRAAGAGLIAVTLRDNLHGDDASEGLLAGAVDSPDVRPRPAAAVVAALADAWREPAAAGG